MPRLALPLLGAGLLLILALMAMLLGGEPGELPPAAAPAAAALAGLLLVTGLVVLEPRARWSRAPDPGA